jgi:hypothetical protein
MEFARVEVTCPEGETFTGRLNARTAGTSWFIGQVSGDCVEPPTNWITGDYVSSKIPCSTLVRLGGQLRISDGTKLFVESTTFTVMCDPA